MDKKEYFRKAIIKKGDSQSIVRKVLDLDLYKQAQNIHIFVSKSDEPDTRLIIKNAWSNGKKVFVPYIERDKMYSIQWEPYEGLREGKFGIGVPCNQKVLTRVTVDIIFVPLVAFDQNKNRLGRGGGFYDRFLVDYVDTPKIGLAFGSQKVDEIPMQNHDIPLDIIITD